MTKRASRLSRLFLKLCPTGTDRKYDTENFFVTIAEFDLINVSKSRIPFV